MEGRKFSRFEQVRSIPEAGKETCELLEISLRREKITLKVGVVHPLMWFDPYATPRSARRPRAAHNNILTCLVDALASGSLLSRRRTSSHLPVYFYVCCTYRAREELGTRW